MDKIAIITAGGVGNRMNCSIPKQFIKVNNKEVIIYTLEVFNNNPNIDHIIIVCLKEYINKLSKLIKKYNINKVSSIVDGSNNRQESVLNGLLEAKRLFKDDSMILTHDSVRPLVNDEIINNNIDTCLTYGNSVTCISCSSSLLEKSNINYSNKEINRDNVIIVQTPETFILKDILNVYNKLNKEDIIKSNSLSSIYLKDNNKIYYSNGSNINIKLTTIEDLELFKCLIKCKIKNN